MPHHEHDPTRNHVKSGLLRWILICIGWISIACGIVGLFLPLVPTVPFLLLSVYCFSKSSVRFHDWLVEHRHLGPMLRDYLTHGGIPLRVKIMAIGMIWISFPVSVMLFIEPLWLKVLLLSIAGVVTLYLIAMPTVTAESRAKGTKTATVDPTMPE